MDNRAGRRNGKTGLSAAALSALADGNPDNLMAAIMPGGIEAQEAKGQRDLVAAGDKLPKRIQEYGHDQDDAILGILGITITGEADDIFNYVTLPDGWTIRPTDHSMWSELVDNQERVRAGIFYKAAFYDRSAHIGFNCRYNLQSHFGRGKRQDYRVVDCADGSVLFTVPVKTEWGDKEHDKAKRWLDKHFPDNEKSLAYWDDDKRAK